MHFEQYIQYVASESLLEENASLVAERRKYVDTWICSYISYIRTHQHKKRPNVQNTNFMIIYVSLHPYSIVSITTSIRNMGPSLCITYVCSSVHSILSLRRQPWKEGLCVCARYSDPQLADFVKEPRFPLNQLSSFLSNNASRTELGPD